jgi:hypothetical protein
VKHHPVAIAAIQQQEGIENAMRRQFLFVQTINNLVDDICMTCQQYNNVQGVKTLAKKLFPKEGLRHANAALTGMESKNYEKYRQ